MENHWELGRWWRVPVAMDWTVLLAIAWLYILLQDWLSVLIAAPALFALFCAHEFGHVAVARWLKVPVYAVNLNGVHGTTERDHARAQRDEVLIAWSGVGAQLLLMLIAALAYPLLAALGAGPWAWTLFGPVLWVWTKYNIFLIIVALLPIGPTDGHQAWKVFRLLRELRNRPKTYEKVVELTPARRRALQADSARKASEIIENLRKK